ncbi:MAG: polyprenyl synthetase family protein [Holosporales bacterium]|jgi:geranylgeranyl pyrophosphate synthase|nr:polyprenyl synthetase family protein [Holosporales bacterium]
MFTEIIDQLLLKKTSFGPELETLDHYIAGLIALHDGLQQLGPRIIGKGKRIRSILYLAIWNKTCCLSEELKFKTIAILEIIHFASLLHDDVIDGHVVRRGEPSFAGNHGDKTSILMGDLTVIKMITEFMHLHHDCDIIKNLFLRECSSTAYGAILEQRLHIESPLSEYVRCASLKTGSLFKLACFLGSYISVGDFNLAREMAILGLCVGIIFQLQNDIDGYGSTKFEDSEDYIMKHITFPIVIVRDYFGVDAQKLFVPQQSNYEVIRSTIHSAKFRDIAEYVMGKYLAIARQAVKLTREPSRTYHDVEQVVSSNRGFS